MQNHKYLFTVFTTRSINHGIVVVVLALLFSGCHPVTIESDPEDTICREYVNNGDMADCYAARREKYYNKLYATYAQLRQGQSSRGRERLKKAMEAWKRYNNAQCKFEFSGMEQITFYRVLLPMCEGNGIIEYQQRLDQQLHCVEGDIGCGGDKI